MSIPAVSNAFRNHPVAIKKHIIPFVPTEGVSNYSNPIIWAKVCFLQKVRIRNILNGASFRFVGTDGIDKLTKIAEMVKLVLFGISGRN